LTEAENCECFSLAGHYLYCDKFPEDAVNEKLFPHALEGWKLLKQNDFLCRKYPKELRDLDSLVYVNGKLFGEFRILVELDGRRECLYMVKVLYYLMQQVASLVVS
jgi:hypothetical protein